MKDRIQLSVFFCEDYRVEEGGKPMILGLLSPVGLVEVDDQVDDTVYVFGIATCPADVEVVEVVLNLKLSSPGAEDKIRKMSKTLRRYENADATQPWVAWIPHAFKLPLNLERVDVRADIRASKTHAWATMMLEFER